MCSEFVATERSNRQSSLRLCGSGTSSFRNLPRRFRHHSRQVQTLQLSPCLLCLVAHMLLRPVTDSKHGIARWAAKVRHRPAFCQHETSASQLHLLCITTSTLITDRNLR